MSMSRHRPSAATTPMTLRISDSAAPYAYWPFSNARRYTYSENTVVS